MSAATITTIDLIRHGEPVGGRKYRGQLDDPLSEKGWQQMRDAVGEHCPWHGIVSSPLQRCSAFAQELAQRHRLEVVIEPRLQEIGFGVWEGCSADEIQRQQPGILQRFWRDPLYNMPEGAEPLASFRDRVIAAWEDILTQNQEKHILIVAHAGVIRMIMRHILDMPLERVFRIKVNNAALTRIRIDDHGPHSLPNLIFHDGRL